jgi:hypothetical protein
MLLDMSARPRGQSKRNHSAVTAALHLYVGKTSAAKGFSAWHIGRWNFDIETIAATISLVIIQRLV